MKKLLIITGPQGSGNHFFSRIFSIHPEVSGWESLTKKYWVPSDEEPFAKFWVHPEKLTEEMFKNSNYFLANVSCPFFYDGQRYIPKILEVAERAKSFGVEVQIAIIVRDKNINEQQQLRVRGEVTTPIAQYYYYNTLMQSDFKVHFLDNEALFLHREHYLKWVSKTLDFPVDYNNSEIFNFITEDPNKKYIKYVEQYWLDEQVWTGVKSKKERGIDDVEGVG
jgi:hypothetical protein